MEPPRRRLLLQRWLGEARGAMAAAIRAVLSPETFSRRTSAQGQAASDAAADADAAMRDLLVGSLLLCAQHAEAGAEQLRTSVITHARVSSICLALGDLRPDAATEHGQVCSTCRAAGCKVVLHQNQAS